jgi:hypothetical protein
VLESLAKRMGKKEDKLPEVEYSNNMRPGALKVPYVAILICADTEIV